MIKVFIPIALCIFGVSPLFAAPVYANSNANTGAVSYSRNWAGYVAKDGGYTSVEASWVVPLVQPPAISKSADATWIGIGGSTSNDLIQAGTAARTDRSGGTQYVALYELLPHAAVVVPLSVHAGDHMYTRITRQTTSSWQVTIQNTSTNKVFTKTVSYSSSLSSVEWIEEMVTDTRSRTYVPLDDFGSVTFTGARTARNGSTLSLEQSNATPLVLAKKNREALVSVSGVTQGDTFTATREHGNEPSLLPTTNVRFQQNASRTQRRFHREHSFYWR